MSHLSPLEEFQFYPLLPGSCSDIWGQHMSQRPPGSSLVLYKHVYKCSCAPFELGLNWLCEGCFFIHHHLLLPSGQHFQLQVSGVQAKPQSFTNLATVSPALPQSLVRSLFSPAYVLSNLNPSLQGRAVPQCTKQHNRGHKITMPLHRIVKRPQGCSVMSTACLLMSISSRDGYYSQGDKDLSLAGAFQPCQ